MQWNMRRLADQFARHEPREEEEEDDDDDVRRRRKEEIVAREDMHVDGVHVQLFAYPSCLLVRGGDRM